MRRSILRVAFIILGCWLSPAAFGQSTKSPLESTRLLDSGASVREISLDGEWQAGIDRHYDRVLKVPGIATDPSKPTPGTLWYKRTIELPAGYLPRATLTLKGARFAPEVYVDGKLVSSAEGGMATTVHRFAVPTGKLFTLEIALHSLTGLDSQDASAVPPADLWRNNVSSYLWDSVVLRLHGDGEIGRIIPSSDPEDDSTSLHWELGAPCTSNCKLNFRMIDDSGKTLVQSGDQPIQASAGKTVFKLNHRIESWSPEHPHLYRLRAELSASGRLLDVREQSFGLRSFSVHGLTFQLNGEPYPIRMGTVVWHRWTRDAEAKDIAFDPVWFERNIVLRLKGLGANALRFHLGLPPEQFLDLCDRDGLAVQMEWPFFHGVGASKESLDTQWRAWLDTAMRHPSVVIVQAWNETGEGQLKVARAELETVLRDYPPMVVNHRDVTAVHKYWWSLFENLGLYYDSASQFGQAAMVDEFGGDYLDNDGNPGTYPATREALLRFLGRDNTREERLQLQSDANARVAEYWRRLGVAGFSPFCILASPEDGNTWFLGPEDISSPTPKPVWRALAAAWAPQSVSLELWNRNFLPGETIHTPLWFFNDDTQNRTLSASVHVVDDTTSQDATPPIKFQAEISAHSSKSIQIDVPLPARTGEWRVEAHLDSDSTTVAPVISSWHVRTFVPQPSEKLRTVAIGVRADEIELRNMLEQMHLKTVLPSDPQAKILLGSRATWQRLAEGSSDRQPFEEQLHQGKSVVLLDAGPQPLGVGYNSGTQLGGPLEGAPSVSSPPVLQTTSLFGGVTVSFRETAEPESTLQQAADNRQLWLGVPRQATWLWNGLRGGLIVPAADMLVSGLSGHAVLAIWQARGADISQIQTGNFYAYELAGYYAFSNHGDDQSISAALRKRVKTMVDDAPSLAGVVNPNAPITVTDVGALYHQSASGGEAESLTPLANAGKGLSRTPIVKLTFGPDSGSLILSQVLTAGRLLPGHAELGPGVYGLRYDPVAVQFVLNMLNASIEKD